MDMEIPGFASLYSLRRYLGYTAAMSPPSLLLPKQTIPIHSLFPHGSCFLEAQHTEMVKRGLPGQERQGS